MGVYAEHVLPRTTDLALRGRPIDQLREPTAAGRALHFAEHGRAPDPGVARWQARLNPLQRKLFGGCHLDRPIDELVRGAGLDVTRLDNQYLTGPKPFGYMYVGVALKPC